MVEQGVQFYLHSGLGFGFSVGPGLGCIGVSKDFSGTLVLFSDGFPAYAVKGGPRLGYRGGSGFGCRDGTGFGFTLGPGFGFSGVLVLFSEGYVAQRGSQFRLQRGF